MKTMIAALALSALSACGASLGQNVTTAIKDALPEIGAAIKEGTDAYMIAQAVVKAACTGDAAGSDVCTEALKIELQATEALNKILEVYKAIQEKVDAAAAQDAAETAVAPQARHEAIRARIAYARAQSALAGAL